MLNSILFFTIGLLLGIGITYFIARRIFTKTDAPNISEHIDLIIKIANEKLSSERELTSKDLESKKELIDDRLLHLDKELKGMTTLVRDLEQRRTAQFSELRTMVTSGSDETKRLIDVTNKLNNTLSSKQARGSWAERMAFDILSYAGMVEGVNYIRQERQSTGNKPDFTFFLPNGYKLNMDVKFPLENYERYNSATDTDMSRYKAEFVSSIKKHLKDITSREYINVEDNTVDSVLMFIPNERIYTAIFEADASMLNLAIENRILICSPVSIISVLSIIRQAADNFVLEQKAKELLLAMGGFRKQWQSYLESFDMLGNAIDKVSDQYTKLKTTRSNQLDKSVKRLDELRERSIIDIDVID